VSLGSFVGDSIGLNEVGDLLGMMVVGNAVGVGDGLTSNVPIDVLISLIKMGIDISIEPIDMLISLIDTPLNKGNINKCVLAVGLKFNFFLLTHKLQDNRIGNSFNNLFMAYFDKHDTNPKRKLGTYKGVSNTYSSTQVST
jgi:hypothetical protein